jgi:hypothetical protein
MHPALKRLPAGLALLAATGSQAADPTVYNDGIPHGTASFDAVVAATGAHLKLQPLWPLQAGGCAFMLPDFTIRATDGGPCLVDDDDNQLREAGHVGALSGRALGSVAAVPELPTVALWLAGLLALGHLARRRSAVRQPLWNGVQRLR